MITDADMEALIRFAESGGKAMVAGAYPQTAEALRELRQWRSGIEPATGAVIGKLVVMPPWTDETE